MPTSLVTFQNFIIVPKELQGEFAVKVSNYYFDTTILGIKGTKPFEFATEENITDQMVDMMFKILREIPDDDDYTYEDERNYGHFVHDIVLVLEQLKLSYLLKDEGERRNMPIQGVW